MPSSVYHSIPCHFPLLRAACTALAATAALSVFAVLPASAGISGSKTMTEKRSDWLVNPAPFVATVKLDGKDLVLENGLVRRIIRVEPNAATTALDNLVTGQAMLRAVGPEARITLNGKEYAVGGLSGQPIANYLRKEWIEKLHADADAYKYASYHEEPLQARFGWKKHSEWLSNDLAWPPPGRHVVLLFHPPVSAPAGLPDVEVHYEIYNGLPLVSKWISVANKGASALTVNRFVSEEVRFTEPESNVEAAPDRERPDLWVETDYAFGAMDAPHAANKSVWYETDPDYPTQVHYDRQTRCLLRCKPPLGPEAAVAPGAAFESFRTFELLLDSTDRERRGLAQRRMYRTIAPWTAENPLMFHLRNADPPSVRRAIDQAHQAGFEMIIMSFGSGFNFENRNGTYIDTYKTLAAEAKAKGIALGGYSLLASRGAATAEENTHGPKATYGVMPCLGAQWGKDYLAQLKRFLGDAGLQVLEHDGSYPGDQCDSTTHPYHKGLDDSQWVMWQAISDLYRWCRSEGVFLNIPDWYFLNGGNKCGMGYRETNWSLPRAEQEIIERQNIFDGTWTKTGSMGWMMVPLSEYQGGGEAATIEPLHEHLDHYEARLSNLVGAGVQACYRGPRLFDTPETLKVVQRWTSFYKAHRQVLDGDMIHLRRANGRDWDGWLHVNPQGEEKGMAFLYNPLAEEITRTVSIPTHYTGVTGHAQITVNGAKSTRTAITDGKAEITVKIPARSRIWLLIK